MQRDLFKNNKPLLPDEIKELNKIFDSVGYESVLFTYHSKLPNSFIRIAHSMNPNHKFKYMVAIRPYTISIEFLSTICEAFNEISPDRIILNMVVGNLLGEDDPKDITNDTHSVSTYEKRLQYHKEFMRDFTAMENISYRPKVYVSGSSGPLLNTAIEYSDGILTEIANYDRLKSYLELRSEWKSVTNKNFKKIIFQMPICIRDTKKEAEEVSMESGKLSLYGNKEYILKQLKTMEEMGIKEIMLYSLHNDTEYDKIHEFIKEIMLK